MNSEYQSKLAIGIMVFLILMGIGGCGYLWVVCESNEPILQKQTIFEVQIIDTYYDKSVFNSSSWTTVVQMPDGTRKEINGKLGEKGEKIKVNL